MRRLEMLEPLVMKHDAAIGEMRDQIDELAEREAKRRRTDFENGMLDDP